MKWINYDGLSSCDILEERSLSNILALVTTDDGRTIYDVGVYSRNVTGYFIFPHSDVAEIHKFMIIEE